MISVRRRLLVGLLALVLTVDGLAGFLSYRQALHSTSTLLDYQLRQMALSLRDQGAAVPDVSIPTEDRDFDFVIQIWDSVRNLVDNALRYTPPGGRVPVKLLEEGAAAKLEVEDSGRFLLLYAASQVWPTSHILADWLAAYS